VFPTLFGKKSGGKFGLSLTFRELLRRAEVRFDNVAAPEASKAFYDKGFHALRHSSVSHMANAGVAEEIRKEHVGHSSEVHKVYTHRDVSVMERHLELMPDITVSKSHLA
jgi:integrase